MANISISLLDMLGSIEILSQVVKQNYMKGHKVIAFTENKNLEGFNLEEKLIIMQ